MLRFGAGWCHKREKDPIEGVDFGKLYNEWPMADFVELLLWIERIKTLAGADVPFAIEVQLQWEPTRWRLMPYGVRYEPEDFPLQLRDKQSFPRYVYQGATELNDIANLFGQDLYDVFNIPQPHRITLDLTSRLERINRLRSSAAS